MWALILSVTLSLPRLLPPSPPCLPRLSLPFLPLSSLVSFLPRLFPPSSLSSLSPSPGYVGKLKLQVPVRYIKSQPWVLEIDQLYLVAGPPNLNKVNKMLYLINLLFFASSLSLSFSSLIQKMRKHPLNWGRERNWWVWNRNGEKSNEGRRHGSGLHLLVHSLQPLRRTFRWERGEGREREGEEMEEKREEGKIIIFCFSGQF